MYVHYAFLHDRIQQAAYASIPAAHRSALHLSIGRIMLGGAAVADLDSRIFDIVHHLNLGMALMEETAERTRLALLNLRAGTRAKNSTAYGLAVQLYSQGIRLLGASAWNEHYDDCYELHSKLAESLCLTADYAGALTLLEEAARHARPGADLWKLHALQVVVCVNKGDMRAALEYARPAAAMLGIRVAAPDAPAEAQLDAEIAAILRQLEGRDVDGLLELPPMTDPAMIAAMSTVVQCLPAASQFNRPLYALICCKLVALSLEHGNCAVSAKGYGTFTVILSGLLGRYRDAYDFGRLGVELSTRLDDMSMRSSVYFTFAALASAWNQPIAESVELFRQGIKYGLQSGDHAHVGYNAARCVTHLQYSGLPLPELEQQVREYEQLLHRVGARLNLGMLRPRLALLSCLQSAVGEGGAERDRSFDAVCAEIEQHTHGNRSIIADLLGVRLFHRCLFGNYGDALAVADALAEYLPFSAGFITVAESSFYHSLAMTGAYSDAAPEQRAAYDAALARNQQRMQAWMEACPGNFAPLYLLVEAECARLHARHEAALDLYDRAIGAARHVGYVHVEAIACERAMGYWEERGKIDFANFYLERALQAYEIWGAHAKVVQLARARVGSGLRASRTSKTVHSTTGTTSGTQALDVAAVVKAAQAISGEIVLESLLTTLMDIIVENAGAEVGALVLESGGRLLIQASKSVGAQAPTVMSALPLEQAEWLPAGIVNYVIRTREHVVIDDATQRSRFGNDPYVQARKPKSVLCAPLLHKGELKGALYVENSLVSGAFTPHRLEAINILLSQVAVSIENATLYAQQAQQAHTIAQSNVALKREIAERRRAEDELGRYRDHLEELVGERTRELEEAQGRLVALSRRAGMAEVAAGVLHNVGNVMNSVNVGASMAREAIADLPTEALLKVSELLQLHAQDLGTFLTHDDKGRRIPQYLDKLGRALNDKRRNILGDLDYMMEHLEHMKRIVSAQQSYAKGGSVTESSTVGELVETALAISAVGLRASRIEVVREIETLPALLLDRHGVLQILVNLLSNAKHALEEHDGDEQRVLKISARAAGECELHIEVCDNGAGIAPDILTSIFNHGFTTRRNGHGFGLHNSANAAQAMNGRLSAHSAGPGRGARFLLQLPLRFAADEHGQRRA